MEKAIHYSLKIADIYFNVSSFEDKYCQSMFEPYIADERGKDCVEVICQKTSSPLCEPSGNRLTMHSETNWHLTEDGIYVLTFYDNENNCICATMTYDASNKKTEVTLLDVENLYGVDTEFFLYNVLERAFRIALIFNGGFAVHASSIVHENYGIAFSADSGTGKSTHTGLWIKNYHGTYILNDDAPALRCIDGVWYIYGTPWAGTTGINANVRVPLKALVFLERSPENTIEDIPTMFAIRRIFEAIIHPMSDEVTDILFTTLSSFLSNCKVCLLGCNMTDEAPKTVRDYLF